MSFITYIVTRGSSNIEKMVFSVTGGLLLLMLKYWNTFDDFQLKYLIYNTDTPYQVSFLLYSLMFALVVYVIEPFEQLWHLRIERTMKYVFPFKFTVSLTFKTLKEEIAVLNKEFIDITSNTYILIAIPLLSSVIYFYGLNWLSVFEYYTVFIILILSFLIILWRLLTKWAFFSSHTRLIVHGYSKFYLPSDSKGLDLARQSKWTELRTQILLENTNIIRNCAHEQLVYMGQEMQTNCSRERFEIFFSKEGAEDYRFFQKLLPQENLFRDFAYYRYTHIYESYKNEREGKISEINEVIKLVQEMWPQFLSILQDFHNQTLARDTVHDFRLFVLETLFTEIGQENFEKTLTHENFFEAVQKTLLKYEKNDPRLNAEQATKVITQRPRSRKLKYVWGTLVENLMKIHDLAYLHHQRVNELKEINEKTIENLQKDAVELKRPLPSKGSF